jgi:kinetochore protein Spc7/SPC105
VRRRIYATNRRGIRLARSLALKVCDLLIHSAHVLIYSQGEYEALQRMHLWRFLKVTETQLNMTYDDHISISIPCQKYDPIPQRIQISLLPEEKQIGGRNSQFPVLSDIMVDAARKRLGHENDELEAVSWFVGLCLPYSSDLLQIIRTLSVLWSSISRVRSELRLLTIKHPTNLVASSPDGTISLHVTAILLFPSVKSKVLVHFSFSEEVLCTWPLLLRRVGCNVEVVYGNVK